MGAWRAKLWLVRLCGAIAVAGAERGEREKGRQAQACDSVAMTLRRVGVVDTAASAVRRGILSFWEPLLSHFVLARGSGLSLEEEVKS